ncbi:MAG: 16S rRNA (adenine(1518)-N(6)/adenine(1519)-N(6))-dimethyltransferase RsmA [Anaerovoracaceae bacterium]
MGGNSWQYSNVRIINEDVLKLDINRIIEEEQAERVKIIGNLPYYITTPIIMKLLDEEVKAESITVMMQKEVADRIKAGPGSKAYGAISAAVQYYCTVEKIIDVPRTVFVPQPKVDSVVLKFKLREQKAAVVQDKRLFFECIKAGFGQRRKTLLNSLQTVRGTSKEVIAASLAAAGIDASRRAETLTLEEFGKISNEVYKRL